MFRRNPKRLDGAIGVSKFPGARASRAVYRPGSKGVAARQLRATIARSYTATTP